MTRLIDADALKEKFKDREGDDLTVFHFYDVIDSAPTRPSEITTEDIQNAIQQGYKDGFEMAKAKYERPQVECKDCKYFFDTVGRCDNCNRNHWYSDNFIRKSI